MFAAFVPLSHVSPGLRSSVAPASTIGLARAALRMRQRANAAGNEGEYEMLDRGRMKKTKTCEQCEKPMVWRKKWEKNWDEVRYCSDRCRSDAARARKLERRGERSGER